MSRLIRLLRLVPAALFWPWNIVLCCVMLAGYLPMVMVSLVVDAVDGLARWDFVGGSLVMVLVPPLSILHVVMHRKAYKEDPVELATFFFGVELPLLAMTAARLFGFHQLSGAAELVYLVIVGGGMVAEARAVMGHRLPRGQIIDGVLHAVLVLRAVAGAYVGVLLATLTMPVLTLIAVTVAEKNTRVEEMVMAVVMSPLILFFGGSMVLVLLLPVAAPLSWLHGVLKSGRAVRDAWGWDDVFFTSVGPVVAGVLAFAIMLPQPHTDALAALAQPPSTDDERRALVVKQHDLELGLVDAYLGPHIYLGDDRITVWSDLWSLEDRLIHRRDLRDADGLMQALARPFVYDGRLEDAATARQLYRDFFGRELERDHAPMVREALSATWSREARFAGFINQGQQRVRLDEQTVRIDDGTDSDGVFSMEVHDVWVNQTGNDEEVALFFELPESAAVTGLWLGASADKREAFAGMITPRGAAQQIYNEEVRAKRDPALLEQIGPRQYRLRVFPIPAKPPRQRSRSPSLMLESGWADGTTAPRVHVWMTWQSLPDQDGHPSFPKLRERRNGFWDAKANRSVDSGAIDGATVANHAVVDAVDAVDDGEWIQVPKDLLAAHRRQQRPVLARVGADAGCARLTPTAAPQTPSLAGQTVDVVIDRSLELAAHTDEIKAALADLKASGATLRVVLGTSRLRGEDAVAVGADVDVQDVIFFGAARPKALLQQLLALRTTDHAAPADLIVVLTGAASFDVADDSPLSLTALPGGVLPKTVLVHLGGQMPAGYDDVTIDAIRRSGGAATTALRDGLTRLGDVVWVDGYRFEPTVTDTCADDAPGRALIARQHILLADRGGMAPLDTLDRLHRFAVRGSVVTPYSSMLVLVNARQRARLAQLEGQTDRFDREVDNDGKAPAATATPPAPPSEAPAPRDDEDTRQESKKDIAAATVGADVANNGLAPQNEKEVADKGQVLGKAAEAKTKSTAAAPSALAPSPSSDNAPTMPEAMPTVSGVPEPEEWLLMLLCAAVVVFEVRRRRLLWW